METAKRAEALRREKEFATWTDTTCYSARMTMHTVVKHSMFIEAFSVYRWQRRHGKDHYRLLPFSNLTANPSVFNDCERGVCLQSTFCFSLWMPLLRKCADLMRKGHAFMS